MGKFHGHKKLARIIVDILHVDKSKTEILCLIKNLVVPWREIVRGRGMPVKAIPPQAILPLVKWIARGLEMIRGQRSSSSERLYYSAFRGVELGTVTKWGILP